MAERNIVDLMNAVNGLQLAHIEFLDAIAPEQQNRALRVLGGHFIVVGLFNTAVSYNAFTNTPAIPNYMPVHVMIPLVVQGFTFNAGIIMMTIGWLLLVSDNPRQHRYLVNMILLLAFIATSFAIGM